MYRQDVPDPLIPPKPGDFRLFCFGLGYSAAALTGLLAPRGWRISGTARDRARTGAIERAGWQGFVFNRDGFPDAARRALRDATHVLVSVPPDDAGDVVLDTAADALGGAKDLRWLGYLSTTGVYGDTGGKMVAEDAALNPSNARSRKRQAAEARWLSLWRDNAVPVHVFRLAGIYGPGRSAFDRLRRGGAVAVVRPGHVSSRIHVDDVAGVLLASMAKPNPGAVYNVADDEACEQAVVMRHAAALLGVSPPVDVPFAEAEKTMSPMQRSFWNDNRRIDNGLIKRELGVKLLYPTYREGLAAILAAEETADD